jgi:predicted pyridoxine 5'-phosphate oxidase superfamily flavin-nucleotide-binding protein
MMKSPRPADSLGVFMSRLYHRDHRSLQQQFDTVRLADRLEKVKVLDHLGADDRAFIEARDMFFLATADEQGRPNCSYKGGDPGFVRVLDERTLIIPNYDGNGMYLSMGNVRQNPHVGLLFIDFEKQKRLRLNGAATLEPAAIAAPPFPEAQFVMRIAVREVFPNCPRYIHKMALVERSKFVPRSGMATPVPGWKQTDWARDVLPRSDPARQDGG